MLIKAAAAFCLLQHVPVLLAASAFVLVATRLYCCAGNEDSRAIICQNMSAALQRQGLPHAVASHEPRALIEYDRAMSALHDASSESDDAASAASHGESLTATATPR